jgi:hypothetical protein
MGDPDSEQQNPYRPDTALEKIHQKKDRQKKKKDFFRLV